MNRKSVFAVVLALFGAFTLPAQTSQYPLVKKITVPGTGGWDYLTVDEAARRVYVSHATQVEVFDADSFEKVGVIPNTPGVHGIALATEFGRGFITAGKSESVII